MNDRGTKIGRRLARLVGYQTKSARAEKLAELDEQVREHPHTADETERGGRRYLRP